MEKEIDTSSVKEVPREASPEHIENARRSPWDDADHGDNSQGQVDWTKKQIAAVFCLSMLWVGELLETIQLITIRPPH
jgi:hypothetical protein